MPIAVLVAVEAGQHVAVGSQQLAHLLAVVDEGGLLPDGGERHVAAFARARNRRVVQLLVAEYQLGLGAVGIQGRLQPPPLPCIDKVAALHSVVAQRRRFLPVDREVSVVRVEDDQEELAPLSVAKHRPGLPVTSQGVPPSQIRPPK